MVNTSSTSGIYANPGQVNYAAAKSGIVTFSQIAAKELSRYGVAPRHLRTFRTATDRETALLEQLMAPALQARNAERRAAGLRDLQALGELSQELSALLFWRDLREVAAG